MNYMIYMTTITISNNTKSRMLEYGHMGETYNGVINRMFDEIEGYKAKNTDKMEN